MNCKQLSQSTALVTNGMHPKPPDQPVQQYSGGDYNQSALMSRLTQIHDGLTYILVGITALQLSHVY